VGIVIWRMGLGTVRCWRGRCVVQIR